MFSAASFCQFVCLFVNTITSKRLNLGWWNLAVRCDVQKISPEFVFQGHRSRTSWTKKEKVLSHPHWQCMVRQRVCCRSYAACSSRRLHCVATRGVTEWWQCTLTAACVRFCREQSSRAQLRWWENQRMLSSFTLAYKSPEAIIPFVTTYGHVRRLRKIKTYLNEIAFSSDFHFFKNYMLHLCIFRRILSKT